MPATDRTTIRAAMDELLTKLRANLAANPPTLTKPFRRVEVADAGEEAFPRPFLSLHLLGVRPIGVTDDDRIFQVTVAMQMVTDATAVDPHAAMLDTISAVEDYLDSIRDTGVIAGAEGLDDRAWTFRYPRQSAGPRAVTAEARQTFVVKVQRAFNRVPAP
jgi:hypothetical protein